MSRDGTTTRLLGAVRRAVVRLVDDSGNFQRVQVEARSGEPIPDVEHLQPYGLTGVAPLGARTLLLTVGAAWDHVVALVTGHGPDRPKGLEAGDVTLYSGHDAQIDLRDSGVALTGDTTIDGSLTVGSASLPGASGTFLSNDSPAKVVVVVGGVIQSIT